MVLLSLGDHPLLAPRGALDSVGYVELAHAVAAGDVLAGDEPFYLSPLYVYFLGLIFAAGGNLFTARIVQMVLGSIAVVLVGETAERWFGRRARVVATVLMLFTGVIAFYEITILQSALDPFLVSLSLWLLGLALTGRPVVWFGAAGGAAALLALNRPNAVVWVAGLAVLLLVSKRYVGAALLGLSFLLVLSPIALRNWVVSRELVLIASHGGLNFYIGNNAEADGTYRHVPGITPDIRGQRHDMRLVASHGSGRSVTAEEASQYFYARAWSWIRRAPMDALMLTLRKLAYTFNRADLALNHSYAFFRSEARSPLKLLFMGPWFLFPLAIAGLAARPRIDRATYLIWAAFVPLYAISVAIFFVSSRYRLPLLIPACILAAGSLREVLRRPAILIVAVMAAVIVNWNFHLDEGRSLEAQSMVFYLIENRKFTEARNVFEQTAPKHPDPAMLYFRTGLALRDAGQFADAAVMFERAIRAPSAMRETPLAAAAVRAELAVAMNDHGRALNIVRDLDPSHFDVSHALRIGRIALELGEASVAQAFFERAVDLEPGSAAAQHELGLAYIALNRRDDAVRSLTAALRLDPTNAATHLNLAVLHAESGNLEVARTHAGEAVRLRPGYEQALGLLRTLNMSEMR